MKEVAERLRELEQRISDHRGNLTLFAVVLREEADNKWDLLVSASWLEPDKKESWDYLVEQLNAQFEAAELLMFSRIVLMDEQNPIVKAMNRAVSVEHGMVEITNTHFDGIPIEQAYLITSKSSETTLQEEVNAA